MTHSDPAHLLLKFWCIRQGVKQMNVADQLGIAASSLSRLMAGEFEPGAELKGRIRELTGIDWDAPVEPPTDQDETADLPAVGESR
jgi:transcriptional regulator with XRE-family HTH domain